MRILGIDPGSVACGYGLIMSGAPSGEWNYLASGRIVLPARQVLHARLSLLHESLLEVIRSTCPDEICIERMFFAKGVKAALSFGHTRGVVLLTAALSKLDIYEYSAREVKKAVTGYGGAEKAQVQDMVRSILRIGHALSPDSADALALALCHGNSSRWDRQKDAGGAGRPNGTSAAAQPPGGPR